MFLLHSCASNFQKLYAPYLSTFHIPNTYCLNLPNDVYISLVFHANLLIKWMGYDVDMRTVKEQTTHEDLRCQACSPEIIWNLELNI